MMERKHIQTKKYRHKKMEFTKEEMLIRERKIQKEEGRVRITKKLDKKKFLKELKRK